jgi:hypothetical protein
VLDVPVHSAGAFYMQKKRKAETELSSNSRGVSMDDALVSVGFFLVCVWCVCFV